MADIVAATASVRIPTRRAGQGAVNAVLALRFPTTTSMLADLGRQMSLTSQLAGLGSAASIARAAYPLPDTYDDGWAEEQTEDDLTVVRDEWDRRDSGIIVPRRRGPPRPSPDAWCQWASQALAEHCKGTSDHPFDCDWGCIGKATTRNSDHLRNTGSEKGVSLWHIRTGAWAILGQPPHHFGRF